MKRFAKGLLGWLCVGDLDAGKCALAGSGCVRTRVTTALLS